MKTSLIAILTATLLGLASRFSGHSFNSADFTAILFTTGLVAWTLGQYSHEPRVLSAERPIRFPVGLAQNHTKPEVTRLAA